LSVLSGSLVQAVAQGTAFTYQGRLNDGSNPANGNYDLRFAIYNAASGGSMAGGPMTNAATAVSNGLFTVTLDFGSGVFDGSARWLDIGVRTNGPGSPGFTTLNPRQALTPTPYAIQAATAVNATTAASVPASGIGLGTANINISGYAITASNLASSATLTSGQIASAGDLVFTNHVQVFTNTASPQNLDLGALIRSLPIVPNKAAGFGGGKIQLSPGTYFTSTNGFQWSTPFMLEIAGSAYGQTAIVFTNWDGRTPCLSLASSYTTDGRNCLSTYIHDLYLCATADKTNSILSITNTARDHLARLVICPWSFATNANGEAGGDYGRSTNTIGLNISSINGQQTVLEDVSLAGLQVGAAIGVDHLRIGGYLGLELDGGTFNARSAAWGTNIYCIGGGLFLNAGINDDVIEGVHSYNCQYPLVKNSDGRQFLIIGGDWSESAARSLTVIPNGSDAEPFIFLFQKGMDNANGDKILQFNGTDWVVIDRAPPNIIDIHQTGTGPDVALKLATGGMDLLTLQSSNVIINSLTLSNLTSPPVFDYNHITISGSTNTGVNGVYVFGYTNSAEGYYVLVNTNESGYGIVIDDPLFGGIILESTNLIGLCEGLIFYPSSFGGGPAAMNGPWTDYFDLDNNVSGRADAAFLFQITGGTVWATNFVGNGYGLTGLQANSIVGTLTNNTTGIASALSQTNFAAQFASIVSTSTVPNAATATLASNLASSATLTSGQIGLVTNNVLPVPSNTNVYWGDSLTYGGGAGESGNQLDFPDVLSAMLHTATINQGNVGAGSTDIKTNFLAMPSLWVYPTIIWSGRNNYPSSNTVLSDISTMTSDLDSAGNSNYLILSILNATNEPVGTAAYVQITNLNLYLSIIYSNKFFDVRKYLVNAANTNLLYDAWTFANDVPAASLHFDSIHLNAAGYELVAEGILQTSFLNQNKSPISEGKTRLLIGQAMASPPSIGGVKPPDVYLDKIRIVSSSADTYGGTIMDSGDDNLSIFSGGGIVYFRNQYTGTEQTLGASLYPILAVYSSSIFSGNVTATNFTGNGGGLMNLAANAIAGGFTTNLAVLVPGGGTNTLCFTNGVLRAIQ
jgi:lysophospholipase L1-like esterase